jgi:hypothetical protein
MDSHVEQSDDNYVYNPDVHVSTATSRWNRNWKQLNLSLSSQQSRSCLTGARLASNAILQDMC